MPFSYIVYKEHRLVVSSGSGLVTWQEIKARQEETKTDPSFDPTFNQIVDLRSATGIQMSGDQARMLASRQIFSPESRRAFVATKPSIFGMGRMWEIYTECSKKPSQIRVFADLPSALNWLGLESLPQ
jgi:hypothetical protein